MIFSYQRYLIVFYWSLSHSKLPQVSRTLLDMLADLNKAVVSARPTISNSSGPLTKPLKTIPRASTIFGIIVILSFNSFYVLGQGPSTCLTLFVLIFISTLLYGAMAKFTIRQVLLFANFRNYYRYQTNSWKPPKE